MLNVTPELVTEAFLLLKERHFPQLEVVLNPSHDKPEDRYVAFDSGVALTDEEGSWDAPDMARLVVLAVNMLPELIQIYRERQADKFLREVDDQLFLRAIGAWGLSAKIDMCIEECSELITILQHLKRGRVDASQVIPEIADVQITTRQMSLAFGSAQVGKARREKLDRLKDRLDALGRTAA